MKRRNFLVGTAACFTTETVAQDRSSLKELGLARGILFGTAVNAGDLEHFAGLDAAIIKDCAIIVPERDMKWGVVEGVRGRQTYNDADKIARFATENGLALRGHTAVWYQNTPAWAQHEINAGRGRELILKRVHDVVGHFRGRVFEWDVVNEMIDHTNDRADGMRNWPGSAAGDLGFITECFLAAREADPTALLVYNDFGFEYKSSGETARRTTALRLMEALKKRGAPIDGFGIQAHLKVGNNFEPSIFRRFLAELAALDLRISVTEFDVDDQRLPAEIRERDEKVSEHARIFLDTTLDEPAVKMLLTWGLSNRFTWLNTQRPRADKLGHRALPLDEHLQPTPLWRAIENCFRNAPTR